MGIRKEFCAVNSCDSFELLVQNHIENPVLNAIKPLHFKYPENQEEATVRKKSSLCMFRMCGIL